MPIRINLLAEAQAAEELRRKDPVKRGIKVAIVLLLLVLVWSSSLYVKTISNRGSLDNLEHSLSARTNQYVKVLDDERQLVAGKQKLTALFCLATNRFLSADLLNAMQHTMAEGVQLVRMRVDQSFLIVPEDLHPKTAEGRPLPAKPGRNTEKIVLTLEAKDASANPGGDGVSHFKEAIVHNPYFQSQRVTANGIQLINLSVPQTDLESGKPFVIFTLECRYQDRNRSTTP